jgi:hypothetical protein
VALAAPFLFDLVEVEVDDDVAFFELAFLVEGAVGAAI